MLSATTSPSYSPTWVSGQMPFTSPIAHSRSPARRWSSTAIPFVGRPSTPTVSSPIPSTRGRRPVATSSRSPRSSLPSSSCRTYSSPSRRAGGGAHPEVELDALPPQRLAERVAQRRGLARNEALGALDQRHLAAETPHDLRQLDARRSAAEHEQATRHRLHAGRLAGAPDAVELAQSGDRRRDRVGAGRHDDVLGGVADAVDFDHAGAGEPAGAPQHVDAAAR